MVKRETIKIKDMILKELLAKINDADVSDLKLYFITRVLKNNVKKDAKVMDKYVFKTYRVEVDDEIRQYLYASVEKQLDYVIKKNFQMVDYDVISDDTEQLFTYPMKNKAFAFYNVVQHQLSSIPPRFKSMNEIISDVEELWAYCVGFNFDDKEKSGWIYTFRKIQAGKVVVDEKQNEKGGIKFIRTLFSTESAKLEILRGETLTLDKQVDCVYYNGIFYILKKWCFEQIVGIEEQCKEEAEKVVKDLGETHMIEGLDKIEKLIDTNPAIHKKLVRISRIGNHKTITLSVVKKMERVCKRYGDRLKTRDGKLLIEDEKDVDIVLKMLADYYKTGDVTGKAYGTFAGKQLTVKL